MSDFSSSQPTPARGRGSERGAQTDRLAWRCRRGLLELDLWLGGFLAASRATLEPNEVAAFERLLAMSDMHILDILQGLLPIDDASLRALIARIQHYQAPNRDPGNEQNSHPQL
ncbi:MAG: FAD assembly factor SdhE [Thiobacillus sp.]